MLFQIKARSVFEMVYFIEADSKEAAVAEVENERTDWPEEYQKHNGETIESVVMVEAESKQAAIDNLKSEGFW